MVNNSNVAINSNDTSTELPLCMFLTTVDDGHENGLQVSGWLLLLPIILNSIAEMIGNIGGKNKTKAPKCKFYSTVTHV